MTRCPVCEHALEREDLQGSKCVRYRCMCGFEALDESGSMTEEEVERVLKELR